MGFSSRSRLDAERYVATERQQIDSQQKAALETRKSDVDTRLRRFYSNSVQIIQTDRTNDGLDRYEFHGMTRTRESHTQAEHANAFNTFVHELEKSEAKLSDEAQQKLVLFAIRQPLVDLTSQENWTKALARLQGLQIFAASDITVAVEQPTEKKPKMDEVSTLTREGNRQAKKLAFDALLEEAQPLFAEFRSFIRATYNHPFTQADQEAVVNFCVQRNLGFNRAAFDKARVDVLNCLTPAEQQAREMDADTHVLTSAEFSKKWGIRAGVGSGF